MDARRWAIPRKKHRNFQEALAEHFEAMREIGEPIPKTHSSVDYVEVAA
jgi:predicted RNase H-like HicB family nuclease